MKQLFIGNVFENVQWNYYYQNLITDFETWYVNEKFFNN